MESTELGGFEQKRYLVEAVGDEPGQEPQLKPGVLILEIAAAPLTYRIAASADALDAHAMVVGMKLWLALLPGALAHGQLTVPLVRGDSQGRRESYEQRAPVYTLGGNRGGYSATSMRCHDFQAGDPETTLEAGGSFDATWTMEAGHPGDCYFYLSYDDPSSASNFFKIAAIPGCGAADGLNIPSSVTMAVQLPAELPPCEHCVLRWEWTGHQQVVDIEFYVQCADVQITSSATPVIPNPMTAIAGIEHLPQDASGQVYSGQGPSEQYLVGPAIASYTPCSAGSPGCIGTSATGTTGSATTAQVVTSSAAPTEADTTEAGTVSTSLRSSTPGSATESPINVDGSIGTCPLPGNGLPAFVSQCYCGFITGPSADGCGPDDGSACWCRCCCHYRSGTCRYQMLEQSFSASMALAPQLISILALSVALPLF